jgi:hypothetical protein
MAASSAEAAPASIVDIIKQDNGNERLKRNLTTN